MTLGYCLDCGGSYEAPYAQDGLCPRCQRLDDAVYANDPTRCVETYPSQFSRAAMREQLGVTGDVDE